MATGILTTRMPAAFDNVGIMRYIHQRINDQVFKEPERVMENIARVTQHARRQITAAVVTPSARHSISSLP